MQGRLIRLKSEKDVSIINTIDEACNYWYNCVRRSIDAEEAFGSDVVYRVKYNELIKNPTVVMRDLLCFLDVKSTDTLVKACIDPLNVRINSSNVPKDVVNSFSVENLSPSLRLIQEYSNQLLSEPRVHFDANVEKIQKEWCWFRQRVEFVSGLDAEYQTSQKNFAAMENLVKERTEWAIKIDTELKKANLTIVDLQSTVEERTSWALAQASDIVARDQTIRSLQAELADRTTWALRLNTELEEANRKLATFMSAGL